MAACDVTRIDSPVENAFEETKLVVLRMDQNDDIPTIQHILLHRIRNAEAYASRTIHNYRNDTASLGVLGLVNCCGLLLLIYLGNRKKRIKFH
jgi:hypothetical protein